MLSCKVDAQTYLSEAAALINQVVMGKWDTRFAQVEVIALTDLNRLLEVANFLGIGQMLSVRLLVSQRYYFALFKNLGVLKGIGGPSTISSGESRSAGSHCVGYGPHRCRTHCEVPSRLVSIIAVGLFL